MRKVIRNGIEITLIQERHRRYFGKSIHIAVKILCLTCNKPKIMYATDFNKGIKLRHFGCRRWSAIQDSEKITNIVINRMIHAIKGNLAHVKSRNNLTFTLSRGEIKKLIFGVCNYCGQKPNQKDRIYDIFINGIDRVDNNLGYEIDNCVSCCNICNYAKRNLPLNKFYIWLDRIARHNGYIKYIESNNIRVA